MRKLFVITTLFMLVSSVLFAADDEFKPFYIGDQNSKNFSAMGVNLKTSYSTVLNAYTKQGIKPIVNNTNMLVYDRAPANPDCNQIIFSFTGIGMKSFDCYMFFIDFDEAFYKYEYLVEVLNKKYGDGHDMSDSSIQYMERSNLENIIKFDLGNMGYGWSVKNTSIYLSVFPVPEDMMEIFNNSTFLVSISYSDDILTKIDRDAAIEDDVAAY